MMSKEAYKKKKAEIVTKPVCPFCHARMRVVKDIDYDETRFYWCCDCDWEFLETKVEEEFVSY